MIVSVATQHPESRWRALVIVQELFYLRFAVLRAGLRRKEEFLSALLRHG